MRLRATAALMGAVLLLTGCSGSGEERDDVADAAAESSESSEATPSEGSAGSEDAAGSDAVVEPSDASVPEAGDPVGERQIVAQGWTMTLEMFPLQRDAGGLVLNARLTYDDEGPEAAPDDMLAGDGAFSGAIGAPDGFALVDKPGGKLYLPAEDSTDSALCSPDLAGNAPAAGDQVYVSCLFGAPPESTTEVDVRASSFGVFSGVPVE